MRHPGTLALLAGLLLFALGGCAGEVRVSDAWIRLLPGDLPAAGYFTLENGSSRRITLIDVSTDGFEEAMLHRSVERNGRSRMMHVERVTAPAGGEIRFAPGGYHLMLMRPTKPLQSGDTLPIVLRFKDGATLTVSFELRGAGG